MIAKMKQSLNNHLDTGVAWMLIGGSCGVMAGILWTMVLFVK